MGLKKSVECRATFITEKGSFLLGHDLGCRKIWATKSRMINCESQVSTFKVYRL
jgi:hypothetical protein